MVIFSPRKIRDEHSETIFEMKNLNNAFIGNTKICESIHGNFQKTTCILWMVGNLPDLHLQGVWMWVFGTFNFGGLLKNDWRDGTCISRRPFFACEKKYKITLLFLLRVCKGWNSKENVRIFVFSKIVVCWLCDLSCLF